MFFVKKSKFLFRFLPPIFEPNIVFLPGQNKSVNTKGGKILTIKTAKKRFFTTIVCSVLTICAVFFIGGDAVAAQPSLQTTDTLTVDTVSDTLPAVKNGTPDKVLIGGFAFGVKYYAYGVLVVGLSDVQTPAGSRNPAYEAGLRIKDIVVSVNGQTVSNETFSDMIRSSGGSKVKLHVLRGGEEFDVEVTPVADNEGIFRLGCLVRDSTAGIGSVTYIDPENGRFGALGHGVCDIDTGLLFTLSHATVYGAKIRAVVPGKVGDPGELKGSFNEDIFMGTLYKNCEEGVFGTLDGSYSLPQGEPICVAGRDEIREGDALVRCTVDDSGPQYYSIKIVRISAEKDRTTKNMVIQIVDPVLLSKTGGIVQGMSGSPIIQDGKLVGAVTHVMVNDPTKGYAIAIENMMKAS